MSYSAFTQLSSAVSLKSGFNAVGLYYNANFGLILKKNKFDLGIKYYGPDKVFEKNTVGFSTGYSYLFSADKIYFGPTVNYSFFAEKKSTTLLHLHELNLGHSLGFNLADKFSIFSTIAVGIVLNSSKNNVISTKQNYFNYEFALGIQYRFGSSDN